MSQKETYEWRINGLNVVHWAKKLKDEVEKLCSTYAWHSQSEDNIMMA
jgi:hypothetical protein